mmetsp:Transcript_8081/g.16847  ORF Transcript_8081/g.16847 Transcript_8081/m.16847 type:complete len:205 (-) Transcript_8081:118-732(-)
MGRSGRRRRRATSARRRLLWRGCRLLLLLRRSGIVGWHTRWWGIHGIRIVPRHMVRWHRIARTGRRMSISSATSSSARSSIMGWRRHTAPWRRWVSISIVWRRTTVLLTVRWGWRVISGSRGLCGRSAGSSWIHGRGLGWKVRMRIVVRTCRRCCTRCASSCLPMSPGCTSAGWLKGWNHDQYFLIISRVWPHLAAFELGIFRM